MILYEVTCIVKEKACEDEFVKYMTGKHVQDVFNCGCFLTASFIKLEQSGTYKSSYLLINKELMDKYLTKYANELRNDVHIHFPNGEVEFSRTTSECLYFTSTEYKIKNK